jgi:hypothetical protein
MEYDFETLAKEIARAKLAGTEDPAAVAAVAAEVAHKVAVSGIFGARRQDPRATVTGTCRGVMAGMVLRGEKDLAGAAVAILSKMTLIAQDGHLDPADCMTWAMEGLASVVKTASIDEAEAVADAIERSYMGAGEAFRAIVRAPGAG